MEFDCNPHGMGLALFVNSILIIYVIYPHYSLSNLLRYSLNQIDLEKKTYKIIILISFYCHF